MERRGKKSSECIRSSNRRHGKNYAQARAEILQRGGIVNTVTGGGVHVTGKATVNHLP